MKTEGYRLFNLALPVAEAKACPTGAAWILRGAAGGRVDRWGTCVDKIVDTVRMSARATFFCIDSY